MSNDKQLPRRAKLCHMRVPSQRWFEQEREVSVGTVHSVSPLEGGYGPHGYEPTIQVLFEDDAGTLTAQGVYAVHFVE